MNIATLNLCYHAHRWEERLPLIVQSILDHKIDLIGLQEVWTHMGSTNQSQIIVDAVNQQLGREAYQAYFTDSTRENSQMGIAILSRLPVEAFNAIPLPGPWRVAQMVKITLEGRTFGFVNTHLHNLPVNDESIRLPQAERLMAWVQEQPFPLPDQRGFQCPPDSVTIHKIKETYLSAFETVHGSEPEFTFPTPLVESKHPRWMTIFSMPKNLHSEKLPSVR